MNLHKVFMLFTIFHGFALLGSAVYVLAYYLPKKKSEIADKLRWWITVFFISYSLLTIATIITVLLRFYPWGDLWYSFVGGAYIGGDMSLLFIFRVLVKKP